LKNDIDQHEYWLVTKDLLQDSSPGDFTDWMKWHNSVKQTEAGEIHFHYTQLSQLKNKIVEDPLPQLNLKGKTKIYSASKDYETDIITLFHAAGAFEYRHRWWEGVKKAEELNHYLPRVGMQSRWIVDSGETTNYSSSYTYTDAKIEFSESNEKDNQIIYFTLVKKKIKRLNLQ
jgi:hypothetical protein